MALNLKASAQSRNEVNFDGDSERGGSKGTGTDYDRGVPAIGAQGRCTDEATTRRLLQGARSGRLRGPPRRSTALGSWTRIGLEERDAEGVGRPRRSTGSHGTRSPSDAAKAPWEAPCA